MSLIPIAAQRIRQAAHDSEAAQDFYDAVLASGQMNELVGADIADEELAELNSTEWQWYASWRQERGGDLNPTVIEHLTATSMSRYSRFKLRRLILRDPPTNRYAATEGVNAGEPPLWRELAHRTSQARTNRPGDRVDGRCAAMRHRCFMAPAASTDNVR
jgi:hypothetical protein